MKDYFIIAENWRDNPIKSWLIKDSLTNIEVGSIKKDKDLYIMILKGKRSNHLSISECLTFGNNS